MFCILNCLYLLCCTKDLVMNKSKKISDWLNAHGLFSINGMCKLVGINTPNFMRYKDSHKIPDKYISKIEKILAEYGYNPKN